MNTEKILLFEQFFNIVEKYFFVTEILHTENKNNMFLLRLSKLRR